MSTVYLDAVLEPPRSLSLRGFNRVMIFFGGTSFVMGAGFLLAGAWPVAGFMGLEVLALWLVFRWSFRSQMARMFVQVTADAVVLRRVDGRGGVRHARVSSYFARVEYDRAAHGPYALRLAISARAYALGEHLTPGERETFARRLSDALADARRERHKLNEGHTE